MSEFGNLPVEIVVDILARLSVKSLGQGLCVCKLWRSLIADPFFINKQQSNNQHGHGHGHGHLNGGDHRHYFYITYGNKYERCCGDTYHSLRSSETFQEQKGLEYRAGMGCFTVTSSCNGVLCLLRRHRANADYSDAIHLWNPSIRKVKILPKPRFETSSMKAEYLGMGFVPQTNDCKVVLLNLPRFGEVSSPQTIEIYSLSSDSWRTWTGDDVQWRLTGNMNASVNGAIYWGATKTACDDSTLIVSFHLADEIFNEISLPVRRRPSLWNSGFISVINGKLAFSIKTWVLAGVWAVWLFDGESWMHFYSFFSPTNTAVLSQFMRNGTLVLLDYGRLIAYDMKTKEIVAEVRGWGFTVVNYTESLVLLNEGIDVLSTDMYNFAKEKGGIARRAIKWAVKLFTKVFVVMMLAAGIFVCVWFAVLLLN